MAKGSSGGFGEIFREYNQQLLNFIRSRLSSNEEAEDLLQEVWYQLSSLVNLDDIESISGWLYRVTRNKIIDRYRKKTELLLNDPVYEDAEGNWQLRDVLLGHDFQEDTFFKDLFWNELMSGLEELPPNQREVFVKNELEDMTLQEIADEKKESIKTIISRKGYALKHLRKRMRKLYDELDN